MQTKQNERYSLLIASVMAIGIMATIVFSASIVVAVLNRIGSFFLGF